MRRVFSALLALSAIALAIVVLRTYRDLRHLQEGRRAAVEGLAAARAYAPDMLSYDYRTIDRDLQRAAGHATGPLVGHYRELAATLVPEARRRHVIQEAVVAAAGVESATPTEVHVVVFVNLATSASGTGQEGTEQRVSQGRARLVMVAEREGWRVSGLSTLLGDTPAR